MQETAFEHLAGICLMAAFADGRQDDAEREKLREIFDSFGELGPAMYRRILLKETTVEELAGAITDGDMRSLAYEMAVSVCDADGATTAEELEFLKRLSLALGLDAPQTQAVTAEVESLAAAPLAAGTALEASPGGAGPAPDSPSPAGQAVDGMVLKYAILNGALELLPQSLATMAILPMQMKMVYRIGKAHGFELDSSHIKEFLAVAGVGMSSQMVENFARKLVGKFAKKALGKGVGRLAKGATGPALTFATTYALGQVAKQYYEGGRRLDSIQLKQLFSSQLGQAQQLYGQHAGSVQAQASNLSLPDVMAMVRGR